MKKHYFLGTAADFSKNERIRMRKGRGNKEDLKDLHDFLCQEYGGKQVLITRNGRSAIAAGLTYYLKEYLGFASGEVIINGYTCYAVVQGIEAAGFKPVYADINKNDLNFTLETLEKVVTKNTRAVIVQNTFGNMIDIEMVEKFCKEHKLVLIEDLAHSTGRFYADGREAGTVGDIVVFSFGKEKSIDVINGGAVVFRDPKMTPVLKPEDRTPSDEEFRARIYPTVGMIYRALSYVKLNSLFMRLLLKIGWVKKSADAEVDFTNSTLSDFQAKMALSKLKDRHEIGEKPLREFYLVRYRDEVLKKLRKAGYYFDAFWYERPVSPERYYKKVHFPEDKCPVAVEVSQKIVNIPTYYSKKALEKAHKIVKEYLDEK